MNTYIYGPKDDPYHSSPNWRKPYPERKQHRSRDLVKEAAANKVDFVHAIHPGLDIKWTDEDRMNVLNKFGMMHDLGVRSFAVFFDDISGEGAKADKQADLLNFLQKRVYREERRRQPADYVSGPNITGPGREATIRMCWAERSTRRSM